jgi:hypothetical protein
VFGKRIRAIRAESVGTLTLVAVEEYNRRAVTALTRAQRISGAPSGLGAEPADWRVQMEDTIGRLQAEIIELREQVGLAEPSAQRESASG